MNSIIGDSGILGNLGNATGYTTGGHGNTSSDPTITGSTVVINPFLLENKVISDELKTETQTGNVTAMFNLLDTEVEDSITEGGGVDQLLKYLDNEIGDSIMEGGCVGQLLNYLSEKPDFLGGTTLPATRTVTFLDAIEIRIFRETGHEPSIWKRVGGVQKCYDQVSPYFWQAWQGRDKTEWVNRYGESACYRIRKESPFFQPGCEDTRDGRVEPYTEEGMHRELLEETGEQYTREVLTRDPVDHRKGKGKLAKVWKAGWDTEEYPTNSSVPDLHPPSWVELNPDSVLALGEKTYIDVPMRSWQRDTANGLGAMLAAIQPLLEETTVGGEPKVRSWSDPKLAELLGSPFRMTAEVRKTTARVLVDGGAGLLGITRKFCDTWKIPVCPVQGRLRIFYGNGTMSFSTHVTERLALNIQGVSLMERFIVLEDEVPGVDIVLGSPWLNLREVDQCVDKLTKKSYLSLNQGNCRLYPEDTPEREGRADIFHMSAEDAWQDLAQAGEDDLFVIRVNTMEEMAFQQKGDIPGPIQEVLEEFKDAGVFRKLLPEDNPDLQRKEGVGVHRIPLIDKAVPHKQRPIPMSAPQQLILQELLQDLVRKGYIVPVSGYSAWAAPVLLVKKPGNREGVTNQWRLVTDYRGLNKLTQPSAYVPPPIRDIMNKLVRARIFSKTDNVAGFYQMALAEEDRAKTTFVCQTPEGERKYMF